MRPLSVQRRRRALALMTDQCTVARKATAAVVDPVTGRESWPDVEVYRGRCKVQTYEAYESTPESGGHSYTVQRYRIDLPVTAGPVTTGDVITVTAYRHQFRVMGEMDKTHLTAQRVAVDMIVE